MRASQWFYATLKETPNDAEIISHQYMLRAGLIRKLASGLYTWLPTGLKVLQKIEGIVREEMNKAGALEMLMPAIQPAELWQETGRWETFGGQLLTMQDSNKRDYCFGPTHEEVITDIMRDALRSYKDLPRNFYQIQTKFRDEIRPRFGVMRAREFMMKDAYSFHLNEQSLSETYEKMYTAYCQIFERLGLKYRAVEADSGAIGGSKSHEFQVLAESGEDLIFYSSESDYAANIEKAISAPNPISEPANKPLELIDTPNQKTIADIVNFLNLDITNTVKTLVVKGTSSPLVALILRGDDELNEVKAQNLAEVASPLCFATDAEVLKATGAPFGSLGPVKSKLPVIVDHNARALASFCCGANVADKHFVNAVWGRDADFLAVHDIRNVKEGDVSPDNKGVLKSCRGIEVGHVFQLGDKYAKAMNATVLNEKGQREVMLMGCYGLGISRVVAAAIEQHHDTRGIIWPESIAPFKLVIIALNYHKSLIVKENADKLYQKSQSLGIDVLLDDRNERAGVLFADNDLIGIPHRIVLSEKGISNNQVEYKKRTDEENTFININALDAFIKNI